jgi:hypothetical protein
VLYPAELRARTEVLRLAIVEGRLNSPTVRNTNPKLAARRFRSKHYIGR